MQARYRGDDIPHVTAPGNITSSPSARSAAPTLDAPGRRVDGTAALRRPLVPEPKPLDDPDLIVQAPRSAVPDEVAAAVPQALFGGWLNRPRRVLLTLAAVWVISVFDLGFTLGQAESFEFVELNPIAARILHQPTSVVATFKFGLVGAGTLILLALRRHAQVELACWFLLAAQVYVAVRWLAYFDCVVNDTVNPFIFVG